MKAAHHPRQSERLTALYSYEVLDTDREAEFDDIVKLAAAICETPIAIINLIDAERQWFKAEVGLGQTETPLATSFCSHAILQDAFVEINDTATDPRMIGNPLVHGTPGLRFYAGALLKSENGLPIGTLCVLDLVPRHLTPLQRDAIRVLGCQVMAQLDLRRALHTAETLRKEVDHRVKNSLQLLSSLTALEGRRGDVVVRSYTTDDSQICLECRDTGTGSKPSATVSQPASGSLGMKIAAALTQQLGGALDLGPNPDGSGMRARIVFDPRI